MTYLRAGSLVNEDLLWIAKQTLVRFQIVRPCQCHDCLGACVPEPTQNQFCMASVPGGTVMMQYDRGRGSDALHDTHSRRVYLRRGRGGGPPEEVTCDVVWWCR